MDAALKRQAGGFTNAWTMPIKARIDMLSTGIRTPIGIKVFGPDLKEIGRLGREIEGCWHGPRHRTRLRRARVRGYYLDFAVRRDAIARYGLTVADVQDVIHRPWAGPT